MDYFTFIDELSKGFRSWQSPGQILMGLVVPLLVIGLIIAIVFLYVKMKNMSSDAGSVEKQRKLFINAIKKNLTPFQVKILREIGSILNFENPAKIFEDPFLFEKSVDRFLSSKMEVSEINEPLDMICKDLVVAYEKIYHFAEITTPLKNIGEVETNRLFFITFDDTIFFIGKVVSKGRSFSIVILNNVKSIMQLKPGSEVTCYLWRAGDANYTFKSVIEKVEGLRIEIAIPDIFERKEEGHLPFADVDLDAKIILPTGEQSESSDPVEVAGIIFKINDSELVMRSSVRLEFLKRYLINFTLDDFHIRVEGQVVRDRAFKENNVFYYNVKIVEMSQPAKNVIKNHILNLHSQNEASSGNKKAGR